MKPFQWVVLVALALPLVSAAGAPGRQAQVSTAPLSPPHRIVIPESTGPTLPSQLTPLGGTLFFVPTGLWGGVQQLWSSDGTEAHEVARATDGSGIHHLSVAGEALYFASYSLWKTDGVSTVKLIHGGPPQQPNWPTTIRISQVVSAGGSVFFEYQHVFANSFPGVFKVDLRSMQPTSGAVTVLLESPDARGWQMAGGGNLLFFLKEEQLWRSDATASGTFALKTFPFSLVPPIHTVGSMAFFPANDGSSGYELWRTDGTPEGTVRVKDIRPGPDGSHPGQLTSMGGVLFFSADDGSGGVELWRSDGTEEGTVRVRDIAPGPASASPSWLTEVDGALFFSANDGTSGRELWRSDGTEEGTVLVKDLRPGSDSSSPSSLTSVRGALVFTADDGSTGEEPWRSHGTAEETFPLADLRPGAPGSSPNTFTVADRTLFFTADDGQTGRDLWAMSIPDWKPPTLTCPESQSAQATSDAGASVEFPPATASDDTTAEPDIAYSHPSGSLFSVGTTEVTATATDEAGNSRQCLFTVTVTERPCGCSSSADASLGFLLALAALLRRHRQRRG